MERQRPPLDASYLNQSTLRTYGSLRPTASVNRVDTEHDVPFSVGKDRSDPKWQYIFDDE